MLRYLSSAVRLPLIQGAAVRRRRPRLLGEESRGGTRATGRRECQQPAAVRAPAGPRQRVLPRPRQDALSNRPFRRRSPCSPRPAARSQYLSGDTRCTENDVLVLGDAAARQSDTDRLRTWEIAATSHVSFQSAVFRRELLIRQRPAAIGTRMAVLGTLTDDMASTYRTTRKLGGMAARAQPGQASLRQVDAGLNRLAARHRPCRPQRFEGLGRPHQARWGSPACRKPRRSRVATRRPWPIYARRLG